MFRHVLWRLLGVLAVLAGACAVAWLVQEGPGRALRGSAGARASHGAPGGFAKSLGRGASAGLHAFLHAGAWLASPPAAATLALSAMALIARLRARHKRRYVRLAVEPYRTERASADGVIALLESLHERILSRWWRRLLGGQPAIALEVHHSGDLEARQAWLAVCCPGGCEPLVESALRATYPNSRLREVDADVEVPVVLRLKKSAPFIKRAKALGHFEQEREPPVNRLITALAATGATAFVQLALTPAPIVFERLARRLHRDADENLSAPHGLRAPRRTLVDEEELRRGLRLQHSPLFFCDVRVISRRRRACELVASELRAGLAENRLVERGTALRHGVFGLYRDRVRRGEGNPIPPLRRGVWAASELARLWHLPSVDYAVVPFRRSGVPLAPASPAILRPRDGSGTLRDELGDVSIHPESRKQNTAVPGAVDQGKSSYLIATVAEDLRRERCAVIVLDPKGDAADAAVSLVPEERTCTVLDFARPECGFNPLEVDAPADVIADYVVAALKNLFTDVDIRASSDRYLRNAIIAVLAYDRRATLWDAARVLSVGEEGYSYRRVVAARVRALPEFKEISDFFAAELSAQLADARSTTTAKLDAPVNKLARLLNSASIKRVLLNDSLRVDLDKVIAGCEVLVVKGALGTMGAGNTAVLMQLLMGMLDAALARQQDLVPVGERVAVALKVDEAPLVLNRGFAQTMALKRSAGLETVACWQTDAQWTEREVFDQLDALFAHRVYFATASARDARAGVKLMMPEFSDTVRPGTAHISTLSHPDARLYLPRHHAIASWTTPAGRQPPFIAQTIPMAVDRARIAVHARRQAERGGRPLTDLRQVHWAGTAAPPISRAKTDGRPDRRPSLKGTPEVELGPGPGAGLPELPPTAAQSYRELAELDHAQSVRSARALRTAVSVDLDAADLAILALVAGLRHVLASQLHRRFNPNRALSTTQRRLKRLSDAGLLERFQFHRRDGGGVPMCCLITQSGLHELAAHGHPPAALLDDGGPTCPAQPRGEQRVRQARHEVHVSGWLLALAQTVGHSARTARGPELSVLSPPARPGSEGKVALGPTHMRLPAGRVAHDFLITDSSGESSEVERFATVRPDAALEVAVESGVAIDVLIELDDRYGSPGAIAKLERYDHFLTGWSLHTARYGRRRQALPIVVFVCRSRARARACARAADAMLRACRAYAGEYPHDWQYTGRERIYFAAERDVHEGCLGAYRVPALPPLVRVGVAGSAPAAGEASAEPTTLPLAKAATPHPMRERVSRKARTE